MLAALLAAGTSTALADDNDMTPFYGDSWAALQAHDPAAVNVPSVATQPGVDVRAAWHNGWNDLRARTSSTWHRMTGTTYRDEPTSSAAPPSGSLSTAPAVSSDTTGSNLPDPQAAPAAHAAQGVAPGPAAADVSQGLAGQPMPTSPDRSGPLGSGSKGTVDPTGAGAATMGGSPYGGNLDPNRPNAGSEANQGNP
jgi:hypothetical protein